MILTRGNSLTLKSKVKVNTPGRMESFMRENFSMIGLMEKGHVIIKMDKLMKEATTWVCSSEMEN